MKITLEIDPKTAALLRVLDDTNSSPKIAVQNVLERLIDHAQQGVYRPGAWEREWLVMVFSDDFTQKLEPGDPHGRPNCEHIFQKPKSTKKTRVTIV